MENMDNMGMVAFTKDSFAYINFERISACGDSCASCSKGCSASQHLVKVKNDLGAEKGDLVEVSITGEEFLKLSFLLYGAPLIVMVVAAIVMDELFASAVISSFSSLILCAMSFLIINLYVKKKNIAGRNPVNMNRVLKNLNNQ